MDAEHHPLDATHPAAQVQDEPGELGGDRVADRVGNVDRGGSSLDHLLHDLAEEVGLRAGGVLRRVLHVVEALRA